MKLTERHAGVAVFKDKRNLKEAAEKLARYEELEEQRLLLRLPCKVSDTVYIIEEYGIRKSIVTEITIDEDIIFIMISDGFQTGSSSSFIVSDFGEEVFLSQEAAESTGRAGGRA